MELKRRISQLMRRVRDEGGLPPSKQIVQETFDRLGYTPETLEPEDVLLNFNKILRVIWEETLVTLERHEESSYAEGIPNALMREFPEDVDKAEKVSKERGFKAGVLTLFQSWYPYLRMTFLSVGQSRKTRGGKDFELQIEALLDLARIPYTKQERHNRTDLILPNVDSFLQNRNITMVVSIKRTLRERWAEVAEELFNLRSPNVYLFTADENVSENHVTRICNDYNIHLVVWDDIKEKKFSDRNLVLSYTEWATDSLPLMKSWW
jgi:hypothetical protein